MRGRRRQDLSQARGGEGQENGHQQSQVWFQLHGACHSLLCEPGPCIISSSSLRSLPTFKLPASNERPGERKQRGGRGYTGFCLPGPWTSMPAAKRRPPPPSHRSFSLPLPGLSRGWKKVPTPIPRSHQGQKLGPITQKEVGRCITVPTLDSDPSLYSQPLPLCALGSTPEILSLFYLMGKLNFSVKAD